MSDPAIFAACTGAALPGWILLLVAPEWKWTQRLASITIPALLGAAYLLLFIANFDGLHATFTSFGATVYSFHSPGLILIAWIHFLALDLFAGGAMVRDSQQLGVPHLAVIPCLLLTFLFGPAGVLLYVFVRTVMRPKPDQND